MSMPGPWRNSMSAPSARARSSFSSLPEVTHVRAPRALQIARAICATPPPIPQIRTSSSGPTRARVTHILHAVSAANENAAPDSGGVVAGTERTFTSGMTTSSVSVPGRCSPSTPNFRQSGLSPERQYSQFRQLMPGLIITVSPTVTRVTPGPTASTTPIPSAPRIHGGTIWTPGTPRTVQRSMWLRAAARNRTRTSVGADSIGSTTSSRKRNCSSPPCASIVSARTTLSCYYSPAPAVPSLRRATPRNESPGMIPIKVPPLGESIVEATISRWLKREGEAVAAGETLVELETDKVTVEVPATTSGVLVRRAHQEGDVVALGATLGELDETAAGTPATQPAAPPPAAPSPPAPAPSAPPAPPAPSAPSAPSAPPEVRASPAARRLSAEEGVDLASVQGTGRGGVV